MINIKCREFNIKLERSLKSGEKVAIKYADLTKKEQIGYMIGVCEVFDQMVAKDDCREAKQLLAYIKGKQ